LWSVVLDGRWLEVAVRAIERQREEVLDECAEDPSRNGVLLGGGPL
jgi:hypothetical protein